MSVRVTHAAIETVSEGVAVRATQVSIEAVTHAVQARATQVVLETVTDDASVPVANTSPTAWESTAAISRSVVTRWEAIAPDFVSSATETGWASGGRVARTVPVAWESEGTVVVQPPDTAVGATEMLAPWFGEVVSGLVTFIWPMPTPPPVVTATLFISPDLGASWVQVSQPAAIDRVTIDTTLWPDGIDYMAKAELSNGLIYYQRSFKIANLPASAGLHTWEPFGPPAPGQGSATHTRLWDPGNWWPHTYRGFAGMTGGEHEIALAAPAGAPLVDEVDITTVVRFGTRGSPILGQSNLYLPAEGNMIGLGALASGTGNSSRGIFAGIVSTQIWPFAPCPAEGRNAFPTAARFWIVVRDVPAGPPTYPGNVPGGEVNGGLVPKLEYWAWPAGMPPSSSNRQTPCGPVYTPVRLRVTRPRRLVQPDIVRIQAGVAGFNGTPYWLIDKEVSFPACPVGSGLAGWAMGKLNGAGSQNAFRDAYSVGMTRLSAIDPCGNIPPNGGPAPFPCPPVGFDSPTRLFLGTAPGGPGADGGALMEYGASELDGREPVVAILRPNDIAPNGIGGRSLMHTLYLALSYSGDVILNVTPIVNGLKLTAQTVQLLLIGSGVTETKRFEFPFAVRVLDPATGLPIATRANQGTWLTFELRLIDVCSRGLDIEKAEIEVVPGREMVPGLTFECAAPKSNPQASPIALFLGGDGNILQTHQGYEDDGVPVVARLVANPLVPQGVGADAAWGPLYLALTRRLKSAARLRVTPVVDGRLLDTVTVVLTAR